MPTERNQIGVKRSVQVWFRFEPIFEPNLATAMSVAVRLAKWTTGAIPFFIALLAMAKSNRKFGFEGFCSKLFAFL
jgi:hypothetical protein